MKLLLLAFVSVLISNTASAFDCTVNERRLEPISIELLDPFEMCVESSSAKACAKLKELNFTSEQAQKNEKLKICGYKGSEFKFERGLLGGTSVVCKDDVGVYASNIPGFPCAPFKSKDGKYDIIICTDLRLAITVAIPIGSTGVGNGFLLVNQLGNPKSLVVNEISCGEGRTRSQLKSKAIPRDPKTERSI